MKLDVDNTSFIGGPVLITDANGVELPYQFVEMDTDTFNGTYYVRDDSNQFILDVLNQDSLKQAIQIPNTSKFICADSKISIFECDCDVCIHRRSEPK